MSHTQKLYKTFQQYKNIEFYGFYHIQQSVLRYMQRHYYGNSHWHPGNGITTAILTGIQVTALLRQFSLAYRQRHYYGNFHWRTGNGITTVILTGVQVTALLR